MADLKVKFATGEKGKIEEAKTSGKLDTNDFVVTSDTDELAFINKKGETKFIKSKSSKAYTLKGTDLGALKAGQTIPKEIDMDGLLNLITQKSIPATYTKPTVTLANNAGTTSGNVEAGTSVTPKLRATFNKNDAGDLTAISIKKGSASVKDGTTSPLDYTGEAIVVGDETGILTNAYYGNNNLQIYRATYLTTFSDLGYNGSYMSSVQQLNLDISNIGSNVQHVWIDYSNSYVYKINQVGISNIQNYPLNYCVPEYDSLIYTRIEYGYLKISVKGDWRGCAAYINLLYY